MSISGIGAQSAAITQLMTMRTQFNDLQRQLSTGQKSATYAGLGLDRGLTVSLNAQLSAIGGYDSTIDNVATRINLMNTALDRMTAIGSATKAVMVQANTTGNSAGAMTAQSTAQISFDELLGLLNTKAGDRYLFSGRATDTPAVETSAHILDGDGARAGLKQLIAERAQADLGVSGLGRLTVANGGTSVSLTEQAGVFGMKLASANSTLSNAVVTGPGGGTMSVNFTGLPAAGESITVRFNLPDGTSENLTLTATANSPAGVNEFTIGATATATATNFQAALTSGLGTLAATALTAASAVKASEEFFDGDVTTPPQRVNGPPFNTATAMMAGTTANTVIWYTGETGVDPARGTATARIDQTLGASYGARANEVGIRTLVQNIATLAAVTIAPSNPNAVALSMAMNGRLGTNISSTSGQTIVDIQADLANAHGSLAAAKARHEQTSATLGDFLQSIAGVSNEEVGSKILSLQTRMQASMQTTVMLFQTSLVNYL